jgi:uncharacterized membrane protein YraQ (UPF0718 family)
MNAIWNQELHIFATVVTAIFLEAAPFLLLGSLVSSLIEIYFSPERISNFVPKRRFTGLLFALGAGMVLPTCECGVVPIVRRLLLKGVPSHVAITYMLAAPVINPIVLVSTYVAFRGNLWMVIGRAGLVALSACCMGLWLSRIHPFMLLRQEATLDDLPVHAHGECDCGFNHQSKGRSKLTGALLHAAWEFLDMGKYLILGCLLAGLMKTSLSDGTLSIFANNVFLAVGAMMFLAVILSVCSEADAFVAASFWSFPKVAQLSFIAIGPMVDLKLVLMYSAVFRKRDVLALTVVPTVIIYVATVALGMIVR